MAEIDLLPRHDLERFLRQLESAAYHPVADLAVTAWRTREPVPFARRMEGRRFDLAVGQSWGRLFDCAWLRFRGKVPSSVAGRRVVLLIDINGEACVVDRRGAPVLGLTNMTSVFDPALGRPGKRVVPVAGRATGDERIDLWADAGANDLFGFLQENGTIREACIAVCNEPVRRLHRDLEVLVDLWQCLTADEPRSWKLRQGMLDAMHAAGSLSAGGLRKARAITAALLSHRGGDPAITVSAIGHAHIDLGWLWPFRETVRKGARTFATALALMKHHPGYVYGASQPQLWLWMKERYPALYARMKAAARAGRLEPLGAMWVEADTNLTAGESLVRQILLGKAFFRRELGVEVRNLWLPDTFGYTAALPQIMRKSGIDWFLAMKLSWNRTNRFPHHSFHWKGIDGTTVATHLLPEATYNSPALPRSVRKIDLEYAQRDVSGRALLAYGIGDGGGGPGEEHLERLARMRDLQGISRVRMEPVARFAAAWMKDAARFPTWEGELYLEKHEGTFTTHGANKRDNRRMEKALREAEWSSVLAGLLCGSTYPRGRLAALWRDVLLYQFHDVLPGTSIKRVYDETAARYLAMHREAESLICANLESIAGRLPAAAPGTGRASTRAESPAAPASVLFNTLSWRRTGWLRHRGAWRAYDVPSMGFSTVGPAWQPAAGARPAASPRRLENDLLSVGLARDGSVSSVFDKRLGREVIAEGARANRLALYEDTGDAWDFPQDYRERGRGFLELVSSAPGSDGPCAWIDQEYRAGRSVLHLRISLVSASARLSFAARVRWRETRTMLRTSFLLAVRAPEATCGIAFGSIRRPTHATTSWDKARDEVPCHGWADVSRRDRGTALLADGTYGFRLKDGALELALLRSVPYPGPVLVREADVAPGSPNHGFTDQGDHVLSYALFPHPGDHVAARVVQEACDLAFPVRPVAAHAPAGAPASGSFFSVDADNVILETVNGSEDGNGTILRLYESAGAGATARVTPWAPPASCAETDLLERDGREIGVRNGTFSLSFGPFEIKTVKVRFRPRSRRS